MEKEKMYESGFGPIDKSVPWISIDFNNLPPDFLICEWKHQDYGTIVGNIIRYNGERPDYKESIWIYPDPYPCSQADIWINEFTHYRKFPKEEKVVKKSETLEQFAEKRSNEWTSNVTNIVRKSIIEGGKFERNRIKTLLIQAAQRGQDFGAANADTVEYDTLEQMIEKEFLK